MKIKVNPKKILYVIYMMFILNVTYSVFNTDYQYWFMAGLIVLGLIGSLYSYINGHRDRELWDGLKAFAIPMIIITLVSVFTAIVIYHGQRSDITQSIRRCCLYVGFFLVAYYSVKWFKNDAPRLLVISGLISYATVFIKFIAAGGFDALLHFMTVKGLGVSLEVHNLTYCFGLLFLYYLLSDQYTRKFKIQMLIVLAIAIFFGNKRALYLALVLSLLVYFLFHKFKSRHMRILGIMMAVYVIGAFVYLILIKNGVFELILAYFGIADNSRLKFWNYFIDDYSISLTYWGRGIAYTDNVMASKTAMSTMQITTQTNMHNDILRMYIGFGFWPFLYYIYNFFIAQLRRFRNWGNQKNAWKYFALASCVFFINFFDNMFTAGNFNITFFMIFILFLYKEGNQDNEKIRMKAAMSVE